MSLDNERLLVETQLSNVLTLNKSRPYVFRTRLERALERTMYFAKNNSQIEIEFMCKQLKDKLNYISDQSNQTSDGTLKSFTFLQDDINNLLNRLQNS